MEPIIGTKLKQKHVSAWLRGLEEHLFPGEDVVALAKTNLVWPTCNAIAVTNARVVAFYGSQLASRGIETEVVAGEIGQVDVRKGTSLVITTVAGEQKSFGTLVTSDVDFVLGAARQLAASGAPEGVMQAKAAQDQELRAVYEEQQQRKQERRPSSWGHVEVIGTEPSEKAWKSLADHSSSGEIPWFVIGSGIGGVLSAFEDRCLIVKTGAMTSLMAGSFGGARLTTFHYSGITGIEYNSGLVNGVLEILTPSYQGTANRDYWRGTRKSRNADSNDPYTLSNCLPLAKPVYQLALPRLHEMRAKIAKLTTNSVTADAQSVNSAQGSSGNLAEELTNLAALRDQGLLDDAEFQAAKQAALARYTG